MRIQSEEFKCRELDNVARNIYVVCNSLVRKLLMNFLSFLNLFFSGDFLFLCFDDHKNIGVANASIFCCCCRKETRRRHATSIEVDPVSAGGGESNGGGMGVKKSIMKKNTKNIENWK